MWIYTQTTGKLFYKEQYIATGYAGKGKGKNNHDMQNVSCVGPIPEGEYTISKSFTHPGKGPVCMRLLPVKEDTMFGRSGFMIHGDSIKHPGTASEGCIILDRATRSLIAESLDRRLLVIKGC